MRLTSALSSARRTFLRLAFLAAGGTGVVKAEPSQAPTREKGPATQAPEVFDGKLAAAAPSGAFSIRQRFVEVESIEVVDFTSRSGKPVPLARHSWAGHYSISPDEPSPFTRDQSGGIRCRQPLRGRGP